MNRTNFFRASAEDFKSGLWTVGSGGCCVSTRRGILLIL